MAEISKITLPSGNTYDIKDATAREMISGGITFIVAWDGTGTPVAENIPKGVVAGSVTGTLEAADAQAGAFYLVKSSTTPSSQTLDIYDEYVVVGSTTKSWEKIGDTQLNLSDVVTGVSLSKQTDVVLGEDTTFTNSSSSVSFSGGSDDVVLGEGTTFTASAPTITVTPTTTNIKATATGTAIGADGTANAVTGYANTTTDTFVKSVSAETGKNLVTTTVPNVTNNESVSIPNVTGNSSVTANKSTWSFTMGSGNAAETLIIGGGNGSDVTATNTTLGSNLAATKVTLGTAITVATGATATDGTGDPVVTGVTVGSSASALTSLGAPSTAAVLTGVKVTTQPTIALATDATAGTGVISVATGISTASATQPTITVGSNDKVTAITSLGTATAAAQSISVGTNDKVTALKSTTDVSVTKGNA